MPWNGMNNRLPDFGFPEKLLRNAVNVDIDQGGFVHRRDGYNKVIDGAMMHSGWTGKFNSFVVRSGVLNRVTPGPVLTPIYSGISAPVTYEEIGEYVYLSDGYVSLKVAGNTISHWGDTISLADDQGIAALPHGRIVRHFRGRLYSVSGRFAFYTEPFAYDWYRPATNWIALPAEITIFEPVESGIWIVADKTYFYAGAGPSSFAPRDVSDAKATFGTAKRLPGRGVAWYSERGVVIAGEGELKEAHRKDVATHTAENGVGFVLERDGLYQYGASLKSPQMPTLAASSWSEMEIERKGA